MTRVIVCGSRTWSKIAPVWTRLAELPHDTVIVHGDAFGADRIAARVARVLGLAVEAHPADWTRHGRAAGHRRNAEMLDAGASLVIAFRSPGRSTGTDGMLALARRHGVPVEVHLEDGSVST